MNTALRNHATVHLDDAVLERVQKLRLAREKLLVEFGNVIVGQKRCD